MFISANSHQPTRKRSQMTQNTAASSDWLTLIHMVQNAHVSFTVRFWTLLPIKFGPISIASSLTGAA